MHFLCLHGYGTSNKVFEMQTASLRYELGDHHTFEFAEGSLPCPIAPEIEPFFPANDEYFTYLDPYSAESRRKALADLENYVAEEGPFDGVMAFSLGAALAATFIIRKLQANPLERRTSLPFKCAIFLSGGIPFDYLAVPLDEIQSLWVKDEQPIQVPTAHIWGSNDALADSTSAVLSELCNPQLRTVFIHDGGHDVPGARSRDATIGMVRAIRHTIDLCDF